MKSIKVKWMDFGDGENIHSSQLTKTNLKGEVIENPSKDGARDVVGEVGFTCIYLDGNKKTSINGIRGSYVFCNEYAPKKYFATIQEAKAYAEKWLRVT